MSEVPPTADSGGQVVWCPRCGMPTKKASEAEALAECPERDYAAEDAEALALNEQIRDT